MQKLVNGNLVDLSAEEIQAETDKDQAAYAAACACSHDVMLARIEAMANELVSNHIDPVEKAHWMGVSDAFTRQFNLWLRESIAADREQRVPDEVTYPPLTAAEEQLWSNLAVIQKLTAAIRNAASLIVAECMTMTGEECYLLPADWLETHVLWP